MELGITFLGVVPKTPRGKNAGTLNNMYSTMKWRFGLKKENLVLLLLTAILIGVTTGCLAVGFRFLILYATKLCWNHPFDVIGSAEGMKWYVVLIIPVIGGVLVGHWFLFLPRKQEERVSPRLSKQSVLEKEQSDTEPHSSKQFLQLFP